MRIVAFETTQRIGSVAVLDRARLLETADLPPHQRSAQSLVPAIKRLVRAVGWQPRDIGLVAVTIGPGSFTGLRIGVTAAKTLAYAVGAQCAAVDTLEVVAERAGPQEKPLWTVLDAQRGQLFTRRFLPVGSSEASPDRPLRIEDVDTWLARLQPGEAVSGPPLKTLAARIPGGVTVCPPSVWRPTASVVGALAWKQFQAGHRDDLWQLVPNYGRLSAAEEKRLKAKAAAAKSGQ